MFFDSALLKFIALATTTVLPTQTEPNKARHVVKHISILQELKERLCQPKKETPTLVPSNNNRMCQTEAHSKALSIENPYYIQSLKETQATYKKLVDPIIKKEKEMMHSHFVFYHGQQAYLSLLHDFLKELYQFMMIHGTLKNFELLRTWYEAFEQVDANRFIDAEENGILSYWNDHKPFLVKNMMCANLALFGNATNTGESSWQYFLCDRSINPPKIESILTEIFSALNLDTKYISQLLDIHTAVTFPSGILQQIFIPKDKVDKFVYLSRAYGTPYRTPIIERYFDRMKQRHTSIAPILDLYQTAPEKINNIDCLQARIIFSQDMILNPQNDIHIIRYTTADQNAIHAYQKQLKKLTQEIFTDWLSKKIDSRNPNKIFDQTPLAKLLKLIF